METLHVILMPDRTVRETETTTPAHYELWAYDASRSKYGLYVCDLPDTPRVATIARGMSLFAA